MYTNIRAGEYLSTATQLAGGAEAFSQQTADEVYAHVGRSSADEVQFQDRLSDAVARYRAAIAKADYERARDHGQAVLDGDTVAQTAAIDAHTDALEEADATYKDRYVVIERQRRQGLAGSSLTLARDTSDAFRDEAGDIAMHEAAYDAAIAAAYSGTNGLERTLANLAYNYAEEEADELVAEMAELAGAYPSPWATWESVQATEAAEHLLKPLADAARDQRIAEAEAYTDARDAQNAAARSEWLAGVNAEASLAVTEAAADAAAAGATQLAEEDILQPTALVTPTVDTGTLPAINRIFSDGQLFAIANGWYNGYFNIYYDEFGFTWDWYTGHTYLWNFGSPWNRFFTDWGYDWRFGWGTSFLFGLYGGWGSYYGYWGYAGHPFAWGGWSPGLVAPSNFTSPSTAINDDPDIDPAGEVAAADQLVGAIAATVIDAAAIVLSNKDLTPFHVDVAAGVIALGQTFLLDPKIPERVGAYIAVVHADNWSGDRVLDLIEVSAPEAIQFVQTHVTLLNVNAVPFSYRMRRGEFGPTMEYRTNGDKYNAMYKIWINVPDTASDFDVAHYILDLIVHDDDVGGLFRNYVLAFPLRPSFGGNIKVTPDGVLDRWTKDRVLPGLKETAELIGDYYLTLASLAPGASGVIAVHELSEGDYSAAALEMVFMAPIGKLANKGASVVGLKVGGELVANIPTSVVKLFQDLPPAKQGELLKLLRGARNADEAGTIAETFLSNTKAIRRTGGKVLINIPKGLRKQLSLHVDTQRHMLAKALGTVNTPTTAHHLIPLEALSTPKLRRILEKGADGGFNMNGVVNGMALQKKRVKINAALSDM